MKKYIFLLAAILSPCVVQDTEARELFLGDECCASSTCDGGCASSTCANRASWDVGYASVFLKPYFERDIAFFDANAAGTPGDNATRIYEFDWDLEHSPRVWFGQTGCGGCGWRITYFQFDHETGLSATEDEGDNLEADWDMDEDDIDIYVTSGPNGEPGSIVASNSLRLHVLDFDVFQNVDVGNLELSISGGVRYVQMDRHYVAYETPYGDEYIIGDHGFDGAGPTLRLEGSRPACGSMRIFMNGRGSLLFGQEKLVIRGESATHDYNERPSHGVVLPIFDSQVGLEWQRRLCGKIVSVRAAMEGQAWIGGGGWNFAQGDGGSGWPTEENFGLCGFVLSGEVGY